MRKTDKLLLRLSLLSILFLIVFALAMFSAGYWFAMRDYHYMNLNFFIAFASMVINTICSAKIMRLKQ